HGGNGQSPEGLGRIREKETSARRGGPAGYLRLHTPLPCHRRQVFRLNGNGKWSGPAQLFHDIALRPWRKRDGGRVTYAQEYPDEGWGRPTGRQGNKMTRLI